MGSGSLHGGGVGFSFVGCVSGRFTKGDGGVVVAFVDCFSGGFSNGEDEYRT